MNNERLTIECNVAMVYPATAVAGPPPAAAVTKVCQTFELLDRSKAADTLASLAWGELRAIVELPSLQTLAIECFAQQDRTYDHGYHCATAILAAVLQGNGLARALGSGKLAFVNVDGTEGERALTAADIATAPAELIVGATSVVLSVEEPALWLMCLERDREAFAQDVLGMRSAEDQAKASAENVAAELEEMGRNTPSSGAGCAGEHA